MTSVRLFDAAPSTGMALPVFDKINRALGFVGPAMSDHFPLVRVDLDERAGRQHRVHRPVVRSDETIPMMTIIKGRDHLHRQSAPLADVTHNERGFPRVNLRISGNRNRHTGLDRFDIQQVCLADFHLCRVSGQIMKTNAVPAKNFCEFQAVNHT